MDVRQFHQKVAVRKINCGLNDVSLIFNELEYWKEHESSN